MPEVPTSALQGFKDPYAELMAHAPAIGGGAKNTWDSFTDWLGATHHGRTYNESVAARNEYADRAAVQSARAFELFMDSTATQRRIDDIKKAGLNPWLALQSGSIGVNGSSGVSSNATQNYYKDHKKEDKAIDDIIGTAAKIMMLLLLRKPA